MTYVEHQDGYYWARDEHDGQTFIVLMEDGLWFACGLGYAINETFRPEQIICKVKRPDH